MIHSPKVITIKLTDAEAWATFQCLGQGIGEYEGEESAMADTAHAALKKLRKQLANDFIEVRDREGW